MTTIYLIRHAEAESNLFHRVQGVSSSPLTPLGELQADCLGDRFRDIPLDGVYASDLSRAVSTAQGICRGKDLPLQVDPGLREVDFGIWEDKAFGELMTLCPDHMARFLTGAPDWQVEGGETLGHATRRMYDTVLRLAAAHPGGSAAMVSHGSAVTQLVSALLRSSGRRPAHLDNTGVSCITAEDGVLSLQWYNDTSHLTQAVRRQMRPQQIEDRPAGALLWFRPWDPETEQDYYAACRREGWFSSHGTMDRYDGEAKLAAALRHSRRAPEAVKVVMTGHDRAGMLELDYDTGAAEQVGAIAFYYVDEAHRRQGSGVQLLGEAVSVFRGLGRTRLRLRCAPENTQALRFYTRYGFREIGMAPGANVPLLLLERPIRKA